MRRKLILEISQNESQIREAENEGRSRALVRAIAATPDAQPQIIRPGNNEYSEQCDRNGFGFGGF
jgi:hypothetical protein